MNGEESQLLGFAPVNAEWNLLRSNRDLDDFRGVRAVGILAEQDSIARQTHLTRSSSVAR